MWWLTLQTQLNFLEWIFFPILTLFKYFNFQFTSIARNLSLILQSWECKSLNIYSELHIFGQNVVQNVFVSETRQNNNSFIYYLKTIIIQCTWILMKIKSLDIYVCTIWRSSREGCSAYFRVCQGGEGRYIYPL